MFIWDPDRNVFVIPYVNHPVTWYGVLFASGFLLAYFLVRKIFYQLLHSPEESPAQTELDAIKFTDRLSFFVVIGTILGARIGHVLFYGWHYYRAHPQDIIKIWEGGLASHGGAIGILLGMFIFVLWNKKIQPKINFLTVLDIVIIPTAVVGALIRIGNFINQEITGIPTKLPWGVIFMHPLDGKPEVAVHPVQIYESLFYFFTFFLLFFLWKKFPLRIGKGFFSGLFFLLVFGFRFLVEFVKQPQSELLPGDSLLSMGQILSIPFIFIGLVLLISGSLNKRWKSA